MNKETVIDDIIENYIQLEQSIVKQLHMHNRLHGGTTGGEREDIWRQMFEMIIPKKFVIEQSIFIIDSSLKKDDGKDIMGISTEVDLAIIDENYTPYIFRYGRLKFVPIEAVAVVIECKSSSGDKSVLEKWSNRIDSLHTSSSGIARMAGSMIVGDTVKMEEASANDSSTQTATRPIKIYCSLENSIPASIKKYFHFVINAKKDQNTIKIELNKKMNLFEWHKELNNPKNKNNEEALSNYSLDEDYTVRRVDKESKEEETVSLLTFNFQLNQLLMLINNPLLFPHLSYVRMFNKQIKPDQQE